MPSEIMSEQTATTLLSNNRGKHKRFDTSPKYASSGSICTTEADFDLGWVNKKQCPKRRELC